jgi:hypothetical protein
MTDIRISPVSIKIHPDHEQRYQNFPAKRDGLKKQSLIELKPDQSDLFSDILAHVSRHFRLCGQV